MANFIEIIDTRNSCHRTGLGAELSDHEAEARAYFETLRHLNVPRKRVEFLLDLHIGDHNLVDTVCTDAAGFESLLGHPPADNATYAAYDRAYWAEARSSYHARNPRPVAVGA